MTKARIQVSPEMLSFVGNGSIDPEGWPADSIGLGFCLGNGTFAAYPDPAQLIDETDLDLVFVVATAACRRLFGTARVIAGEWYLPSELRAIGLAIRDNGAPAAARTTLQLAKSIELLCGLFAQWNADTLVPVDGSRELNVRDTSRVVAARRMVDERWDEKLTLESIARACGLNRAKLTRGFRLMFDCTIADALAENRLGGARTMLMSTDLPVSSIGYRCGYLNNASFTRAFSRRFGVAPTKLRQRESAA